MDSAHLESPPSIVPIHTAVPGRARLRVAGLCGSDVLKRVLEAILPDTVGILGASANTLTGNVLVRYDPAVPLATVIARVEQAAGERLPQEGAGSPSRDAAWHAIDVDKTLQALDVS